MDVENAIMNLWEDARKRQAKATQQDDQARADMYYAMQVAYVNALKVIRAARNENWRVGDDYED